MQYLHVWIIPTMKAIKRGNNCINAPISLTQNGKYLYPELYVQSNISYIWQIFIETTDKTNKQDGRI